MPVQPPDMLPPPEEDVQPAGVVDDAAHPAVRHRRAIYLLPNAFTTGNLFAGFYAIVMAMNGEFPWAAIAIFLAMFLDSLDGRVARLTNSQSTFGEQYDSLADMISFGAAPALVIYSWALTGMGKWGWLAAFIYVADWRVSTLTSRSSTSATSRGCPVLQRQRWWQAWSGWPPTGMTRG